MAAIAPRRLNSFALLSLRGLARLALRHIRSVCVAESAELVGQVPWIPPWSSRRPGREAGRPFRWGPW